MPPVANDIPAVQPVLVRRQKLTKQHHDLDREEIDSSWIGRANQIASAFACFELSADVSTSLIGRRGRRLPHASLGGLSKPEFLSYG